MVLDRSFKLLIAIFASVAAIFLIVNHLIDQSPLGDWLFTASVSLVALGFWAWIWQEDQEPSTALVVRDEPTRIVQSQEWVISKDRVVPVPTETEPAIGEAPEPEVTRAAARASVDGTQEDKDIEIEESPDLPVDASPGVIEEIVQAQPGEAEVLEEARAGDQIAEQEIAAAMAAGPTGPAEDQAEENIEVIEQEIAGREITRQEQEIDETPVAPPPDQTIVDDMAGTPEYDVEEPDATVSTEPLTAEPDEIAIVDTPPAEVAALGDDLTRIEGIGVKYQDSLATAGITTYAQLAQTSIEDLERVIRGGGMRRPGSIGTWPEQAAYAARGDWEGLLQFQKTLSAGRRP